MTRDKKTVGYRKLIAWQKANELAFQIYGLTKATRKKWQKLLVILFFVSGLLFYVPGASAASLSFSPPSGSRSLGSTFSVNMIVGSTTQAMNAASGVISFPTDKLEVVSISKTGSIFSLWAEEPSFSNNTGTVNFEGVVLNPGYAGASGRLLTVTFRAKREGVANLRFSSGSVLANDGLGTNILTDLRTAVFTITDAPAVPLPREPIIETPPREAENAPIIQSSTHPDQTKWYASNTPTFSWHLPDGALEVRTLIGKSPTGVPTVSHTPAISERVVPELQDGAYYFALRVRTAAGWSATSRYRVNIDTAPPKPFSITFPRGDTGQEPQPVVLFSTTDDTSGISHYNIQIGADAKPTIFAPQTEFDPYVLPAQAPGVYTLTVTAVDNAGNARASSAKFIIEAIDAPTITYFPEILNEGDIIKIKGITYPDSDVAILIRKRGALVSEEFTKSNSLGDFELTVAKQLESGIHAFTARVRDSRGAQSAETPPFTISIRSVVIEDIKNFIFKYLPVAILIILSLGALIWIGARLWFKIPRSVARMRREAWEAEAVSERAFAVLRDIVTRHIVKLKKTKRKLTIEETAFLEEFEKKLAETEKVIAKEIHDISQS